METQKRSASTTQTGVAEGVSNQTYVGATVVFPSYVRPVAFPVQSQTVDGIVASMTRTPLTLAKITNCLSHYRRSNWMKLEELKKKHEAIAEKTSTLLAEIEAKQNEILSITERLDEINILKGEDIKAQKARAKEKRARLRDEITDLRHNVRLLDGQKEWLMIKAKALAGEL
jgi:hypothetical protein